MMINKESQHSIFDICRDLLGLEIKMRWKEMLKRKPEEG
jgi:hypothetical protein